jgi:hypothetical protein
LELQVVNPAAGKKEVEYCYVGKQKERKGNMERKAGKPEKVREQ